MCIYIYIYTYVYIYIRRPPGPSRRAGHPSYPLYHHLSLPFDHLCHVLVLPSLPCTFDLRSSILEFHSLIFLFPWPQEVVELTRGGGSQIKISPGGGGRRLALATLAPWPGRSWTPKTTQERAKSPQERPKTESRSPKTDPRSPKSDPRSLKRCPRAPKSGSRPSQEDLRPTQELPRAILAPQDVPESLFFLMFFNDF